MPKHSICGLSCCCEDNDSRRQSITLVPTNDCGNATLPTTVAALEEWLLQRMQEQGTAAQAAEAADDEQDSSKLELIRGAPRRARSILVGLSAIAEKERQWRAQRDGFGGRHLP